jgi:hypothetical protein
MVGRMLTHSLPKLGAVFIGQALSLPELTKIRFSTPPLITYISEKMA